MIINFFCEKDLEFGQSIISDKIYSRQSCKTNEIGIKFKYIKNNIY